MEQERLAAHLQDRPRQLEEAKRKGTKVVGYFPGSYVPEELIYASGAIPLCLIHGGNARTADAGLSLVPQVICSFARAQIGERQLKENPYYSMIDLLVAPITCQHLKKVTEIWEYIDDMDIFKLGIPQQNNETFELEYFTDSLKLLKDKLETLTGNEITNEKLNKAIDLYNRIRELLKKISLLRTDKDVPISSLDFVKLNHASYYANPEFMVEILDSVYRELIEQKNHVGTDAPRLLLIGPNIGYGDYSVLELVKEAGGEIVIEEICECVRNYWIEVENKGNLYQSMARGYLVDRLPCAFMSYSTKKRLDFTLQLIKDFNVTGVIWYELLCCETYDCESYYFARELSKRNIPVLILESDYSTTSTGQFTTRIEGFMEIVKGVI